ncbi:MAG TPA: O-antigen ligase family protein, partial [Bacteroidia bacterium]|nr:O-antigen ligase family protein [Bacteroidia bacterium]
VCVLLLARSGYLYFTGNENAFFYETFSYYFHPSYLSLYFSFAIAILFFQILANNKTVYIRNIILMLLFTGMILLLSSKTGIISIVLICILYFLIIVIRKRKIKYYISFLLVGGILYFAVKNFNSRINNAAKILVESKFDVASTESTAARVNIWNVSLDIIKENLLLGVGTGDVKDELFKFYQQQKMTGPLQNKLNAHNQFLQTFIALGVMGFLLLILSLIIPGFYSLSNKDWIYSMFLALITLNLLTESMLERQNGVIFYAFFNSLLFYTSENKIK